jgi:CubicO group peptidase (beta-lactamase class C family)
VPRAGKAASGALLLAGMLAGCSHSLVPPLKSAPPAASAALLPEPARIFYLERFDGSAIGEISGDAGVVGEIVTLDQPVRVASISKLVVALGVMRLVDKGQLDLDRDVGDYLGWQVRNPAFPDRRVTLRQLLSHTASLTDGAGYFLPLDASLRALLADPKAWDSAHGPGDGHFRYANVASPIIAAVMEAATGKRFDILILEQVFAPLQVYDSCFNWSGCVSEHRASAITLLRPNGEVAKDPPLEVDEPECVFVPAANGSCDPGLYRLGHNGSAFSPQGGLRISAEELLKIGKMLARRGEGFLSEKSFAEMTRPHWRNNGSNSSETDANFHAWGLGVDLQPDGWFGHAGFAYGFRGGLWANSKSGAWQVRFATMVGDEVPIGLCLDSCP